MWAHILEPVPAVWQDEVPPRAWRIPGGTCFGSRAICKRRTHDPPAQKPRTGSGTCRSILLLVVLCALASLSGCLTPAKLAEMAQRTDTLSRGAKTDECADAAANAASAVVIGWHLKT